MGSNSLALVTHNAGGLSLTRHFRVGRMVRSLRSLLTRQLQSVVPAWTCCELEGQSQFADKRKPRFTAQLHNMGTDGAVSLLTSRWHHCRTRSGVPVLNVAVSSEEAVASESDSRPADK